MFSTVLTSYTYFLRERYKVVAVFTFLPLKLKGLKVISVSRTACIEFRFRALSVNIHCVITTNY